MEYLKSLSRLQRLCSRAEYCSRDIFRKALKDMEGDEEMATRILESLKAQNYVSDTRFAAAYAREKSALQGWGPVKIRYMLRSKVVPEEDIDAALGEIEKDKAQDKMQRLLAAKYRTLKGEGAQIKAKLLRYGLSRGYSFDEVLAVIDNLIG